ncbi:MotA/TolQ/ExbB proton channel [Thermovirga lienii DSM 17291]|uniref:MotA/TolQ/ExbB proton channel n=1 Tax=Thermovirga lienii (strain ATCC BAA-1197 / DSM 17291 / Cas60314) TaxID=580340 RepID=G7V5K5_THELD|nr:MotA/TolQ/ExbB proton channel [Thermovirga lienii DSM 17291]
MDMMALGFLAVTILLVVGGIVLGGAPGAFINIPSMLITVGGTLGAIGIATPKKDFFKIPQTVKEAFSKEEFMDLISLMDILVEMARKARAEGLLALEEEISKIDNDFIRKSAQLVIDGTPPETVKAIMDAEIDITERRYAVSKRAFDLMAELAPAFGMLGTLIGLIQMLRNLDTPEALGPGMAVALITTFYGSFIANVIAIPISKKISARASDAILSMEIIVEGILSIQSGENPRLVEEKLKIFLPREEREKLAARKASGRASREVAKEAEEPASA